MTREDASAAGIGRIGDHRRIVVKVGSSLLVDRGSGRPKRAWLATLSEDLAALWRHGAQVVVVSSGAIALGRGRLGISGRLKLEEAQAAAAVGQVGLAHLWSEALDTEGLTAAQILLTLEDTERRRRYLNARATLTTLLERRVVPIVNENDTVATSEIRYGDNDRLAARVASMIGADCLVLLSDVDGLYSAPPADNAEARFIAHVPAITPAIEAMAGSAGSDLSRGGMRTKIEAGKIACGSGARMVIADGRRDHPLRAVDAGERATWFDARTSPGSARKAWIMGHMASVGVLRIDPGARAALKKGRSLLPAGVATVEGQFSRGDAVRVMGVDDGEIGRGLVGYDASEARAIAGRRSDEIETILGYPGRSEMIHRDDFVLTDREEMDDA